MPTKDTYPRDSLGRFTTGNPGGGRPRGSRNKIGVAFMEELERAFLSRGRDTVSRVMEENPAVFLRLIASLLPKQMELSSSKFDGMSDEELQRYIDQVEESIASLANTDEGQGGSEGGAKTPAEQ